MLHVTCVYASDLCIITCIIIRIPFVFLQFKRNHYTILRPFKQVTSLYDSLASSHVGHGMPDDVVVDDIHMYCTYSLTCAYIDSCAYIMIMSTMLHTHTHTHTVYQFPDRPDRKSLIKRQKQQMEELLRWIAGNPELRKTEAFVSFLMPDDEFGNWDAGSEVVSCIIY